MNSYHHFLGQLGMLLGAEEPGQNFFKELRFEEDKLFEKCLFHQMVTQVYQYREPLQSLYPQLSAAFFQQVRDYTIVNTTRIMLYESFLKELAGLFAVQGIEFRLLKGPGLAEQLYAESYLRSFGDLDILIRVQDLERVDKSLLDLGFACADDLYSSFPDAVARKYRLARHYIRHQPNELAVDLHLNIGSRLHPIQFRSSDFWDNPKVVRIGEVKVLTFHDTANVIYLLYHALKHYYFKMIWLLDIHYALDTWAIDEPLFATLLQRYDMSRMWRLFRQLRNEIFCSETDSEMPAELIRGRVLSRIARPETVFEGVLPWSHSLSRLILPMLYLSSWRRKFVYLCHQLFPPRAMVQECYRAGQYKAGWKCYLLNRSCAIWELIRMGWKARRKGAANV